MLPDNVIRFLESCGSGGCNEFFKGSHKLRNFQIKGHTADSVIAGCNNAEKFAVGSAVVGNCHCGVTKVIVEVDNVRQCVFGAEV